jgi:hypothetical protein
MAVSGEEEIHESCAEIDTFIGDMIDTDDDIPKEHKAGLQTVASAAIYLVESTVTSLDRIATALEKIAAQKESVS